MQKQTAIQSAAAAVATVGAAAAVAAENSASDKEALDSAFKALKTFDFGVSHTKCRELIGPIEDEVRVIAGDSAAGKYLELRLAAVLSSQAPRAAKDFACRQLTIIGTAASVPALAALLPDKELSHMGRYALERIPAPEAAEALREALAKTSGAEKSGIAGSLGVRRDTESVSDLSALLSDSDELVALAAATALGDIGTVESAKALQEAAPSAEPVKHRVADARLTAAEKLLAAGDRAAAKKVYSSLVGSPVKSVKLAATRGLLLAGRK